MIQFSFRRRTLGAFSKSLATVLCVLLLTTGDPYMSAAVAVSGQSSSAPSTQSAPATSSTPTEATKIPNEQLDSLVAPIALYPDPLLSQVLVASTYPLEIVQLSQWLSKNSKLKGEALTKEVLKQGWDPSVQAMAPLPDIVRKMSDNIKWTDELGNAFLAQQDDVMQAAQRMRKKAKDGGKLESSEQLKVVEKVVEKEKVIVIQQANPEVVYVPSYDPVVVYGAPVYPYYPMVYPVGYQVAGMALSFGVGVAMGAAWGGGWGWNTGWGGGNNDINVNRNNTFVNNSNRQTGNRAGGGNTWQHNPAHRGGAPYSNRATASKYGGASRGDSLSNRQSTARQSGNQRSASGMSDRSGTRGQGTPAAAGDRGGDRGGGGDRSASSGSRSSSSGSRSSSSGSRSSGAFESGGSRGSSARASSSRGSSSMGRSGGGSRGGGRRR